MPEAFYELLEERKPGARAPGTTPLATASDTDGNRPVELRARVRSTRHTRGPWSADLQHAGPPSALLTRAVQRLGGLPPDALAARLCFDILSPVPVADLVLTARTARPGRRVALAEAELAAADDPDRPLMTLRAWLVRQLADDSPDGAAIPVTAVDPAPTWSADWAPMARPQGWLAGYLDAIDWYWVEGSFESAGPATVWTRLRVGLVDGEEPSPLERLVAVADSASGISSVASPRELLFVNTDLTLHLARMPVGEAIWMRARTTMSGNGIGACRGSLGDDLGSVATSAQCLFVTPRVSDPRDPRPPAER